MRWAEAQNADLLRRVRQLEARRPIASSTSTDTDIASLKQRVTTLEAAAATGDGLWSKYDTLSIKPTAYTNTLLATAVGATRDIPSGLSRWKNADLTNAPEFAWGNPYIAGIGLEAVGLYYQDATTGGWRIVGSWEKSGTMATVMDGVRRASFESYIQNGDEKPWFRLEASAQGLQLGAGGHISGVGQATRSGTTLTVATVTEHKFGVGQLLYKQTIGGAPEYGVDSDGAGLTVASVVDATHFTVTVANSGITSNTLPISWSTEPALDVVYARGSAGTAEIRVANGSGGVETIYQGNRFRHQFLLGNALKAYIDTDGFHFTPTYWDNGGGQTQTGQDTFYVSGATTTLTSISNAGGTGSRRRIWNTRTSGSVTVSPSGGDTINGTSSYVIASPGQGVDVDGRGTNWLCTKLTP